MPLRIESVEIDNFRSHKETRLDFAEVNFIVGPNGSGKTSILDAIALCLMGRTPSAALRADAMKAQIREESGDSFRVLCKTNRGSRSFLWHTNKAHQNGDLEIPPKFPTLMRFLFSPQAFFDGSSTVRYNAISDLIGIDMIRVKEKINRRTRELEIPNNLRADMELRTPDDIKVLVQDMKNQRKEAGRKADLYSAFAKTEGSPVDMTELVRARCEIEAYDENCKTLNNLLSTLNTETVANANARWSALLAEIDETQKQYAIVQGARIYTLHRKCPLKMACPMEIEEWQKIEKNTKNLELELQAKLDRLKAERDELDSTRINLANMDVWQMALADLEGNRADIERRREWYEANLVKAGEAADAGEKRAAYDRYAKLEGSLDEFVKYLEREIVPQCAMVDRFNKMLAASPYKIEFRSGDFFWNGRLYEYCSTSQQFRCRIALQAIIGQDTGFIVVDGFEQLDAKGKSENLKVLKQLAKDGFQVFIAGSYTQPYDQGIPVRSISGMKMIWCELDPHGVTQAKAL